MSVGDALGTRSSFSSSVRPHTADTSFEQQYRDGASAVRDVTGRLTETVLFEVDARSAVVDKNVALVRSELARSAADVEKTSGDVAHLAREVCEGCWRLEVPLSGGHIVVSE
jgi:hypothetical protein